MIGRMLDLSNAWQVRPHLISYGGVTSWLVWLITPSPKEWLVWTAAGFQTFGIWKLTEHPVNGDPPTLHVWQFGPIFVILTSESWNFLWLTSCKGVLPLSECERFPKKKFSSQHQTSLLFEKMQVVTCLSTPIMPCQVKFLLNIGFSSALFTSLSIFPMYCSQLFTVQWILCPSIPTAWALWEIRRVKTLN